MPLGLFSPRYPSNGSHNSVQILQGDIFLSLYKKKCLDIAATFMDNVNIRGPPTRYKTDSSGWYSSTAFTRPILPNRLPVPCALGSDGNHFWGYSRKYWDSLVCLGASQMTLKLCPPACQKGGRDVLGWENGHLVVPEVMAVGHRCTYERTLPLRIARFQKIIDWPDSKYSHGGSRFPRPYVVFVRNLGQRLLQDVQKKPLVLLMKKGTQSLSGVWTRRHLWRI